MTKTVLVIDDDVSLQSVLDVALSQAGFKVELASNGMEALERLEQIQPNAVLCDVMMPQMDGVELFRSIRERLRYEGIPIIVMTALNRKPWFRELETEGAVIVQKPFEIGRLVSMVQLMTED